MAIRLSGLSSGLDTESIVKELMAAQRTKLTKIENKQTKLEWKQDKWKELNKKLYSFRQKTLNNLRTQGKYLQKKTSSSDEAKATATANINAAKGTHSLEIQETASAQMVTSGKIKRADGTSATANTTLGELGIVWGTEFTITAKDKKGKTIETTLKVDGTTTISDFVKACKDSNLTASFDENQKRLFISSAETGKDQNFSIIANKASNQNLKSVVGYGDQTLTQAQRDAFDDAFEKIQKAGFSAVNAIYDGVIDGTITSTTNPADTDLINAITLLKTNAETITEANTRNTVSDQLYKEQHNGYIKSEAESRLLAAGVNPGDPGYQDSLDAKIKEVEADKTFTDTIASKITQDKSNNVDYKGDPLNWALEEQNRYNAAIADEKTKTANLLKGGILTLATEQKSLSGLGFDGNITGEEVASPTGMNVVSAKDAAYVLDGAAMTSTKNTVEVNNLTLELKEKTAAGESIKITVAYDPESAYNVVKDFVTKYNELLKEMNELYDAKPAKGYEPLTSEQKDVMTDDEIEKWETKIKDSLLRRDNTLSGITASMRSSLMYSAEIDGTAYSVGYDLGIQTSMDYKEKGLLHILGDEDDELYSQKDNKLMEMLQKDPDVVMELMTGIGKRLYDDFGKRMERNSLKSTDTFYNDIQMDKEQRAYKKQISNMEKKLAEMEDRYYKQFTAMEKAMSQLQSQSNSLASMMGLGGQ